MLSVFGNLAFLNPWALAALLGLPVLYFLLRITPPTPQRIAFPAIRFLEGLEPKQNTPSHTPWWILLLRLLIVALLLLALARPVLNPSRAVDSNEALLLLIDNGWAAGQNWKSIQDTAEDITRQALRQNREIYILTTTLQPSAKTPELNGPLLPSEAVANIRGLKPYPWDTDLRDIIDIAAGFNGQIIWLSDGVKKTGYRLFSKALEKNDIPMRIYTPDDNDLPLILKSPETLQAQPSITIDSPRDAERSLPMRIQLLGERGAILDEIVIAGEEADFPKTVNFDLPQVLQNQAASFRIVGHKGAQARYMLDGVGGPKTVGIVAPEEAVQTRQLTEDSFYLGKALEPYATVLQASLDDIIAQSPSMIVLPDIGSMPPASLNALSEWVNEGGLLLRFAGPNMSQLTAQDALTPVKLRGQTRSVQGSLSWDNPLKIKPFEQESPLYGLSIEDSIEVYEYILPEITEELSERTWATLEDGTPLITAARQEEGLVVMVHTAASPTWSNLPLSGLYVQILKRFLKFSGSTHALTQGQGGLLQPVQIMDGFGDLQSPDTSVKPVDAAQFDNIAPSPEHPPGFYGRGGLQRAMNLGDHLTTKQAIAAEENLAVHIYNQSFEKDLVPPLLIAALCLFILDAVVMLMLSGTSSRIFRPFRKPVSGVLFCILLLSAQPAHAQENKAAQDLYLAYIRTGNASIDAASQKGLEILATALTNRTSAEPKGVMAVDPERDTLSFFPVIYWPINPSQDAPSSDALRNLQDYLDHGGTILVDTRDGGQNNQHMRRVIGGLNIPPLTELPKDHVITKSFYLLNSFSGRFDNRPLWVESQSASGRDGVSSVIISSHDWAGLWAELNTVHNNNRNYIVGVTRRHEMSLRFGVNLVMYALTGNYKADQVHVPHILERLGREQ